MLARRLVALAPLLLLCLASCVGLGQAPAKITPLAGTPTPGFGAKAWSVGAIQARFDPACFCTTYVIDILVPSVTPENDVWTVTWNLKLSLVDPTGAPDPETPGSAAGVDAGCDNAGLGSSSPVTQSVRIGSFFVSSPGPSRGTASFVWYHPDPATAPPGYPPGHFHCSHLLQGPHGHQGIVGVAVTHGAQKCTDLYWGTHSGIATDADQPGSATCFRT